MKLEPKVVTQTTLKTRLIKYGGGGLALVSIIGAIMWFYLQVGNQERSMASTGGIAPSNDTKSGAIWLTDLYEDQSAFAVYSNENATSDAVYGSCFNSGSGQGVWFKFQALYSDATITVKTGGAKGTIQNLEIALFDSLDNEVACANASGSGFASLTPSSLTQDSWYYLLVNSKTQADTGTFTLYINNVSPVKYYIRKDDDWDKTSTWSTSGYGGSAASSLPGKANVVFIKKADGDVKIENYTAECAGLILSSGNKKSEIKLKSGGALKVYGKMLINGNGNKEVKVKSENASIYIQDSLYHEKYGSKESDFELKNSTLEVKRSFVIDHKGGKKPKVEFKDASDINVREDFVLKNSGGNNGFDFKADNSDITVDGNMLVQYSGGSGNFNFDFKKNKKLDIAGDLSIYKNGGNNTFGIYFDDHITLDVGGNFELKYSTGSGSIYFDFKKSSTLNVDGDMSLIKDGGSNSFNVSYDDNVMASIAGDYLVEYNSGSSSFNHEIINNSNFTIGGDITFNKDGGSNKLDCYFNNNVTVSAAGDLLVQCQSGSSTMYFDFRKNSTMTVTGSASFLKSGGTNKLDVDYYDHVNFNAGGDIEILYSGGSANLTFDIWKNTIVTSGGELTASKTGGSSNLVVNVKENSALQVDSSAYLSIEGGSSNYDFNLTKNANLEIGGDLNLSEKGGSGDFDFKIGTSSSSYKDSLFVDGDILFGADNGSSGTYKVDMIVKKSGDVVLKGDLNVLPGKKGRINFNDDNASLILSGASMQEIQGESTTGDLRVTYKSIIVSNSYSGPEDTATSILINAPVELEGTLDLQDGIVRLAPGVSFTFDRNMNLSGGSDSSFIDGPVVKEGSYNLLIPLGDEGVYAPLELKDYSNSSSTNKFTVRYIRDSYTDTAVGSGLVKVSKIEYWTVEKNTGSSSLKVKIVLHWQEGQASGISNLSDLAMARYDGSEWVAVQPTSINGTVTQGSIETNYGQNGFGPYTFGSIGGGNVLPIKLNHFSAEVTDNQEVLLSWETAMEHNNDFFTIERSYDGQFFEEIATVRGAGNSDMPLSYSYIDESPGSGNIYYRLKQTDYDGQFEYFNVEEVFIEVATAALEIREVFPVPFSEQMTLVLESDMDEEVQIDLISMSGSQIPLMRANIHRGRNSISLGGLGRLPKGAYVLTITSLEKQISTKVLKAR